MNFTKNFKWQMALVALGASLVLTGKVQSQEIVNTEFDTPSSSIGSNFNTTAPAAVNTAAADPQAVSSPVTGAAIRATNELGTLGTSEFLADRRVAAGHRSIAGGVPDCEKSSRVSRKSIQAQLEFFFEPQQHFQQPQSPGPQ